jgi:hypothetical protein
VLPFGERMEIVISQSAPVIASETTAHVENIWEQEAVHSGRLLHNGRIFSVSRWDGALVSGWIAEYKWFLAQRREPGLFTALGVRPMAVTGVTVSADGVLIGRRRRDASQDAGLWELVPAGGVDATSISASGKVDLARQLFTELEEECGITEADLEGVPAPFAAVEDTESRVIDAGLIVRTRLSAAGLRSRLATVCDPEHDAFDIVPVEELQVLIGSRDTSLAVVSQRLLTEACSLFGARFKAQA